MQVLPLLLVAVLLLGTGQTGPAQTPPGTQVIRDQPYVDNPAERQILDLYVPPGPGLKPLLVYIHGGAWCQESQHSGDFVPPLALPRGYAVATLDYRFSFQARFPAQLDDCKSALRWLRTHAPEYGIDPERVGVWGYSAGAHLAALLATTGDSPLFDRGKTPSTRVQAAAVWACPADLSLPYNTSITAMLYVLLGVDPGENPAKAIFASPVTYVAAGDPPVFILHGETDTTVPPLQSEVLEKALKDAGVPVTRRMVPGVGHVGLATKENLAATLAFFDSILLPRNP